MENKTKKKIYAFRVLFRYEGDLKKPTSAMVQSYLEEMLATSQVSVPRKILLARKEGKIVVRGQNTVDYSVARILVPCRGEA
jgi:hypothetical protein